MNDHHDEQPVDGVLYAPGGWCAPIGLPDITIPRGPIDWTPKPPPTRRQRLVRGWRKLRDRIHAVRAVWADPDRLC